MINTRISCLILAQTEAVSTRNVSGVLRIAGTLPLSGRRTTGTAVEHISADGFNTAQKNRT